MLLAYRKGNTWFHKMDPLTKTLWCLIISGWMMTIRDPIQAIELSFMISVFSWICAGLDLRKYFKATLIFLTGSVTLIIYQGIFRPGVGIDLGPIHISYIGLSIGTAIAVRTFGVVASALAYVTTTSPKELTNLLIKIGIPYQIAHIAYLALRMMPLIENGIHSISDSYKLRKIRLNLRSFAIGTVALIAAQYRRIDETSIALETRGFGLYDHKVILEPVSITFKGIATIVATVFILVIYTIVLSK